MKKVFLVFYTRKTDPNYELVEVYSTILKAKERTIELLRNNRIDAAYYLEQEVK